MNDWTSGAISKTSGALMVLSILKEGSAHGYAIASAVQKRSGSSFKFKQGTLYPLLHELEEDGFIVSEWHIIEGERPRRVYTVTEDGLSELQNKIEAWIKYSRAVSQVTGVKVGEQ